MLYAMSSIDEEKFELIAASFNQSFSIFSAGATAIGDGVLISNGVSQLNELDQYINSTGKAAEGEVDENLDQDKEQDAKSAMDTIEEAGLQESEQMAENVQEAVNEKTLNGDIDVDFTHNMWN